MPIIELLNETKNTLVVVEKSHIKDLLQANYEIVLWKLSECIFELRLSIGDDYTPHNCQTSSTKELLKLFATLPGLAILQ